MAAEAISPTASAEEVLVWLRTYKSGKWAVLATALEGEGATGEDLYRLTETQLEKLCRGPRGILLFNFLHREWPRRQLRSSLQLSLVCCASRRYGGVHGQRLPRLAVRSALLQKCGAAPLAAAARRTAPPT